MKKNLLIMGDTHIGAKTGLLPPEFDAIATGAYDRDVKLYHRRREMWDLFEEDAIKGAPKGGYDFVIHGGDVIDGIKHKGGTDQLLFQSLDTQADIGIKTLEKIPIKKGGTGLIVLGTEAHSDNSHISIENDIADAIGWDFKVKADWYPIFGVPFNICHKMSGSNRSYLKANMLAIEYNEAVKNFAKGVLPGIPAVILRFHKHVYVGIVDKKWQGFVCPSLQCYGDNYAAAIAAGEYPDQGIIKATLDTETGRVLCTQIVWDLNTQSKAQ